MYASRSLWDGVLPRLQDMGVEPGPDGTRKSYVPGQEDQRLRLVERVIDLGEEGRFLVAVAGDATEIDEEIVAFDRTLAMTFAVLALVLLLTTLFQVRFGLAPLKRISESLAAIRSGAAEKLEARSRSRSRRLPARPTRCSIPTARSSSARAPTSAISRMRSRRRCR